MWKSARVRVPAHILCDVQSEHGRSRVIAQINAKINKWLRERVGEKSKWNWDMHSFHVPFSNAFIFPYRSQIFLDNIPRCFNPLYSVLRQHQLRCNWLMSQMDLAAFFYILFSVTRQTSRKQENTLQLHYCFVWLENKIFLLRFDKETVSLLSQNLCAKLSFVLLPWSGFKIINENESQQ